MPVAWATNRPPAHVLVTEDDQDMRILLGMFLGLHAYQVAEASDGERVSKAASGPTSYSRCLLYCHSRPDDA
jgi:DNA-binding response OmpR family regulator